MAARFLDFANAPPSRNDMWGGRGMGPRMREDNGRGLGLGWVYTPILTFPPQGGREGEGWVPASAGTRGGEGVMAARFLDFAALRSE